MYWKPWKIAFEINWPLGGWMSIESKVNMWMVAANLGPDCFKLLGKDAHVSIDHCKKAFSNDFVV